MTKTEFRKEFGAEWVKLIRKPIIRALIDTIRTESPLERAPDTRSGDIVVGGQILYAECKGWHAVPKLMAELAEKDDTADDYDPTYKEDKE
jgi:hypothetical protein